MNSGSRSGKRWLRIKHVAEYFGISTPTAWRWVGAGKLPAGVKFGSRTTVWDSGIIQAYSETLIQKAAEEAAEKERTKKAKVEAAKPVQKIKLNHTAKTHKTAPPQPTKESVPQTILFQNDDPEVDEEERAFMQILTQIRRNPEKIQLKRQLAIQGSAS